MPGLSLAGEVTYLKLRKSDLLSKCIILPVGTKTDNGPPSFSGPR